MKNSSDFSVNEIEKLITISNKLGITIPENQSTSINLYLDSILKQLNNIPYVPFTISFHTVDIVPVTGTISDNWKLLLGRKPDKTKFQFIGGFMNPGETSNEAATRELLEETNIEVNPNKLYYIGSFPINDTRFTESPHKITTSFYYCFVSQNHVDNALAKDDIEEIRWFDIGLLKENEEYKKIIAPLHIPLFESFIKSLEI